MRVLQLTDCHIYGDSSSRFHGIDTKATFDRVLDSLLPIKKADLIVGTGDLSMDGSAQAYEWLENRLLEVNQPVFMIPGNHDRQKEMGARTANTFFLKNEMLVKGSWCLHFINTANQDGHAGKIGQLNLTTLSNNLSKYSKNFHVIFMHHPPVEVGSVWLDEIGLSDAKDFWCSLQSASNVKLIVCGHIHQELDVEAEGIRVLASPSTCLQFKPRTKTYTADKLNPGFRIIDFFSDGTIKTEVVRVLT